MTSEDKSRECEGKKGFQKNLLDFISSDKQIIHDVMPTINIAQKAHLEKVGQKNLISNTIRFQSKNTSNDVFSIFKANVGKGWTYQRKFQYYKNKSLKMIWGETSRKDAILDNEKIKPNFEIIARGYDREKFLQKIETYQSEVVVYLRNQYYNFIHVGIACKVLESGIQTFVNSEHQLLCQNEQFFFIIQKLGMENGKNI
jgi:hypothetical protein